MFNWSSGHSANGVFEWNSLLAINNATKLCLNDGMSCGQFFSYSKSISISWKMLKIWTKNYTHFLLNCWLNEHHNNSAEHILRGRFSEKYRKQFILHRQNYVASCSRLDGFFFLLKKIQKKVFVYQLYSLTSYALIERFDVNEFILSPLTVKYKIMQLPIRCVRLFVH